MHFWVDFPHLFLFSGNKESYSEGRTSSHYYSCTAVTNCFMSVQPDCFAFVWDGVEGNSFSCRWTKFLFQRFSDFCFLFKGLKSCWKDFSITKIKIGSQRTTTKVCFTWIRQHINLTQQNTFVGFYTDLLIIIFTPMLFAV